MNRQPAPIRYMHRAMDYMAYIHRPELWPQMARNITNKATGRIPSPDALAQMKAEATAWCAAHCVKESWALERLGFPGETLHVEERYLDTLSAARTRADAVPVKMGGGGHTDLLYTLCEYQQAMTVIETGVAYGWSSLAILLSLKNRPDAHLISIDLPYFERHNDEWVGIAVPKELKEQWTLLRMADREGIPKALKIAPVVDFIHYDSDKSESGRAFAYPLLWNALKPGGILMSDDIQDNMGFARFCESINTSAVIVRKDAENYQGVLRK